MTLYHLLLSCVPVPPPPPPRRTSFDCNVDFGRLGARDAEVGVEVVPDRAVHEVDPLEVQVLRLGHVERELEVQCQVIWKRNTVHRQ